MFFAVLQNVIFYCEFLILKKRDKLIGSRSSLHKAIIFCAVSKNLQTRNITKKLISKVGKTENGVEIILELLSEYSKFINSMNNKVSIIFVRIMCIFLHSINMKVIFYLKLLKSIESEFINNDSSPQQTSYNSEINKRIFTDAMFLICTSSQINQSDMYSIALNCLVPCHHPVLSTFFFHLYFYYTSYLYF